MTLTSCIVAEVVHLINSDLLLRSRAWRGEAPKEKVVRSRPKTSGKSSTGRSLPASPFRTPDDRYREPSDCCNVVYKGKSQSSSTSPEDSRQKHEEQTTSTFLFPPLSRKGMHNQVLGHMAGASLFPQSPFLAFFLPRIKREAQSIKCTVGRLGGSPSSKPDVAKSKAAQSFTK